MFIHNNIFNSFTFFLQSKLMNKDLDESLRYLFEEYKRLKLKEKKQKLTFEENETLKKLSSFLGKSNEK